MFDRLKSLVLRRPNAAIPSTATQGGFMAGVLPGIYSTPPPRSTAGLLEASTTMPWLYACAWKAADAVAAQPWKAFIVRKQGKVVPSRALRQAPFATRQKLLAQHKDAGELEELESHPLLDSLDTGNPYFPGRQTRALTQLYLDTAGEGYWIKERNSLGMPLRYWILPPTWIQNLPGPERPTYRVGFRGWQGEIPESEILRFVRPNPVHPYERGTGLARALGDELETYEYASRHTKQVFFNQARPDLIISGKDLSQDNTERLEQKWTSKLQGFWNVAKPFFVKGEIMVTPISQNFQHLELVKLREHERDMILQTFGFPPEIFGINQNSNRATINEAAYIMSRFVTLPRLELQREFLQTYLVPEFDERIILEFENPVEDDQEFILKVMTAHSQSFTVDEHRALAKHAPLDGNEGQKYIIPNKVTIADSLKPTPKPVAVAPKPAPKPRGMEMSAAIAQIVKEELAAATTSVQTNERGQLELTLRSRIADLEQRLVEQASTPTQPATSSFHLSLPDAISEQMLKTYEVVVPTPAVIVPQPKRYRDVIVRDENENSPTFMEILEVRREILEFDAPLVVNTEQLVTPTPRTYTETVIRDERGEITEVLHEAVGEEQ